MVLFFNAMSHPLLIARLPLIILQNTAYGSMCTSEFRKDNADVGITAVEILTPHFPCNDHRKSGVVLSRDR